MKKLFLFVILLCYVNGLSGQDGKITKDLDRYKELKGYDGLSINLIRSDKNQAVITGENTDKVTLVNNEGVLKVRMTLTKMFSGYRTFIDLYHTEPLLIIDVNEDARISSDDIIKQDVLELRAQEGGEIEVKANVDQFLVRSVSGGIIKATGTSNLQDVAITTGGVYEGKDFKTKFCTVNVNAGSRATIFATDYVKASVKAGGEVNVYGNPPKMDEKTVFGGKINKM